MLSCPSCRSENPAGSRFCGGCGGSLSSVCAECGAANDPAMRFCTQCGSAFDAAAASATPAAPAGRRAAPVAERRLVSVLFVDLIGFTSLSDTRDAEDVRELLSRYFGLATTLIGRYGGTVEKFIGDAVMAVWGTPTATEDDAERAVRAGLDLVASIAEIDPSLQARAGVLTGEAAVTIGAEGQGMVAGDLVNTASRVQSTAAPGTVLVGEATKRASESAIAYEDAGVHELKGKAEPLMLYRALRVVSARGGQLRSVRLEAPFVGRERELKLIKDLFHASAQDGRAHLVSVTGIAGIGKSRLAWEFYKYFDGIVDQVYWQRGRCLAYGEGVAYWALADMVRMRCRIGEQNEPETAREKLRAALAEHIPDPEERTFVEPRLAHLLGLEDRSVGDRQDLFAAWRLFFERLSDRYPTVLAFEDMHWADTSLLDFVEYLLEWSRDHPLYVITLARPELHERREGWGAGPRNFTSLYLEPLPQHAMDALLDGLVPGLPVRLREQILDRAEGVPLYAVETVRMLLDRGLLEEDEAVYRPTGEIATLAVPESLHALIAARLDGISADERRVLQEGAVLGRTFTDRALAAVSGVPGQELEPLLAALVRKEVLGVQSDPRSPEHGQYGFLQDLVRHVAYGTLSKRERRTLHLAAAAYLEGAFAAEDEIAEVLAAHYAAAFEAAPDADDAAAVRATAAELHARAGDRAASLGAPEEGRRYYERAAELVDEPLAVAQHLEQAGRLAVLAAHPVADARELLERALTLRADAGDARGAARASAALADVDFLEGQLEAASARLEQAAEELERDAPSPELALVLAQLGRMHVLSVSQADAAAPVLERALALAERFVLPEVFVEALNSKAVLLMYKGRRTEAQILLEAVIAKCYEEQLFASALRALNNLTVVLSSRDRYAEALELVDEAIALATRRGDRRWLENLRTGSIWALSCVGRWDEALALTEREMSADTESVRANLVDAARIMCERGQLEEARALLAANDDLRHSQRDVVSVMLHVLEARLLRLEGRPHEALAVVEPLVPSSGRPLSDSYVKELIIETIEAALATQNLDAAESYLALAEGIPPGERSPNLQAHAYRLRARLESALGTTDGVAERFASAAALFREFGLVFDLAVTELEHAEWLDAQGRGDEAQPLLAEARDTFERLQARPWTERAAQALADSVETPVS